MSSYYEVEDSDDTKCLVCNEERPPVKEKGKCALLVQCDECDCWCHGYVLSSSLPESSPLNFTTKNSFPLFFVVEEALVSIY